MHRLKVLYSKYNDTLTQNEKRIWAKRLHTIHLTLLWHSIWIKHLLAKNRKGEKDIGKSSNDLFLKLLQGSNQCLCHYSRENTQICNHFHVTILQRPQKRCTCIKNKQNQPTTSTLTNECVYFLPLLRLCCSYNTSCHKKKTLFKPNSWTDHTTWGHCYIRNKQNQPSTSTLTNECVYFFPLLRLCCSYNTSCHKQNFVQTK